MARQLFTFRGATWSYTVYLRKGFYDKTLRTAIKAFCEDGSPAFIATVNLPEFHLEPDEIFVKDYSENEGVLAFLVELGIVTELVRYVKSGYVHIPVCKYNADKLDQLTK